MTFAESSSLRRECGIFSRYLIGSPPDDYVCQKYDLAHSQSRTYHALRFFDLFLVKVAVIAPAFAKLADSYARVFARRSALRKKLILLLAILESSYPAHQYLNSVDTSGMPILLIKIVLREVVFVLSFLLSAALLLPAHVGLVVGAKILGGTAKQ